MGAKNKVFIDSNYFIALNNQHDSLYKESLLKKNKIEKENPQLFISNLIFLEVVTILSQRAGREMAITIGEKLLEESGISIIPIDTILGSRSWKIFKTIKRKNVSFVDCSILASMEYEGINKLLTFDRDDFSKLRKKYHFSFY